MGAVINEELREDLFYFIVFGPGYGESVLLRAPDEDWIVIDGCLAGEDAPAARLLRDSNRRWSCIVLTHPHLDHAMGLDRVLELPGAGPVGCADPSVQDPRRWASSVDPEQQLHHGIVEQVLAAVHDRWTNRPEQRWLLRRGDVRQVGHVTMRVLHPPEELVRNWKGGDVNRLSSALLVEWERLRLLLGADVVNDDWTDIVQVVTDLDNHAALKVPHHGSMDALHEGVGGPPGMRREQRTWVVTPYNRGRKLPGFGEGEGLAWLLDREDRIFLTGLPLRFESQQRGPLITTREGLLSFCPHVLRAQATPVAGPDPACFVAVGFGADGTVHHEIRGAGSVLVCREPSDPTSADIERGRTSPFR